MIVVDRVDIDDESTPSPAAATTSYEEILSESPDDDSSGMDTK